MQQDEVVIVRINIDLGDIFRIFNKITAENEFLLRTGQPPDCRIQADSELPEPGFEIIIDIRVIRIM